MGYYIVSFAAACLMSLCLTPVVRCMASRFGFLDHPDDRKHQRGAVALGGGAAVFVAAILAGAGTLALAAWRGWEGLLDRHQMGILLGLSAAAILTTVVGVLDDTARLRTRYKVLAQLVAGLLVVSSGLVISQVTVLGATVPLGLLSVPFTLFWLCGAINAMNLIDGSDGVASSVGLVLCLTIAIMSIMGGHSSDAMVSLSLAGALLGFLCYNFPPAMIYLGDAGSMLIGLVVGTMAVSSSIKGAASVVLAVPVAIWAVPILDSCAAVLRRKLTGRSLFCVDRGHLHHVLLQRGWTSRATLTFITGLAAVTSGAALLSVHFQTEWIAIVALAVVVTILCVTRIFGHIELALVTSAARQMMAKGWTRPRPAGQGKATPVQTQIRLQGTHEWQAFWSGLTEGAERLGLVSMNLSIHLPAMEEAFYASWDCPGERGEQGMVWSITAPLVLRSHPVGRLVVAGEATDEGSLTPLAQLIDFLEPMGQQLEQLAETLAVQRRGGTPRQPALVRAAGQH